MSENQLETIENASIAEKPFENEFDVSRMLQTAGSVELSEEQKGILFASVNEEDVEIRPDGIIYLPWMQYAWRMTEAFGMQWALIPQGMPKHKKNDNSNEIRIIWGFWLVVQGSLCGYAIGEQRYYSESRQGKDFMTYSDACEGAKSNALMRLCKGIGISLELWKPSFIRQWKKKYATKYFDKKKNKYFWRLKDKSQNESQNGNEEPKKKNAGKQGTPGKGKKAQDKPRTGNGNGQNEKRQMKSEELEEILASDAFTDKAEIIKAKQEFNKAKTVADMNTVTQKWRKIRDERSTPADELTAAANEGWDSEGESEQGELLEGEENGS